MRGREAERVRARAVERAKRMVGYWCCWLVCVFFFAALSPFR